MIDARHQFQANYSDCFGVGGYIWKVTVAGRNTLAQSPEIPQVPVVTGQNLLSQNLLGQNLLHQNLLNQNLLRQNLLH